MRRIRKYLLGATVLVTAGTAVVCCAGLVSVTVSNYTDGSGYYSWTLTRGAGESNIWGVGTVGIESYGVEQIFSPTGWSAATSNAVITWTYTNGTWFIHDIPVMFAVQSAITNSRLYTNVSPDHFFPQGALAGWLYDTNHSPLNIPGSESFDIIGPEPRPRFSGFSISNSQAMFSVEEMMGRTCYVERTIDLMSNAWQAATNFTVQGLSTNLTDPIPAMTNLLFYRLRFTH